jgi:hypothetical protein
MNKESIKMKIKINKKFFLTLGMVVLLATLLVTSACAGDTRIVRFASVTDVKVLGDQPATFRLAGSYTCNQVKVESFVSGKTIYINAYDVKIKYTGQGCDNLTKFRKNVNVGRLVPGVYTIVVNPDANGKGQKVIKGFIAPLIPAPAQ